MHVDSLVIGAGVIGLAVARRLALAGRDVVLLEANDAIGLGISSRNSEVIHAGLYYRTGSLKARLCLAGKQALYRYCESRGVPHRRCGKLIVATEADQRGALESLVAKAAANGVSDLQKLDPGAVAELEPNVRCVAAFHSPGTGIIDAHQLMLSYLGEAEAAGAMLALKSPFLKGHHDGSKWQVEIGGENPANIQATQLVNAAGLLASRIAWALGLGTAQVPATYLAKGSYFSLAGGKPAFARLVYPLPEPGGLGVHVTLDLAGRVRFGPDVEWIDTIGYTVDPRRAARFYPSIRRYFPALPDDSLQPAHAGIRPKLSRDPNVESDFLIQGPADHGAPGLINLLGIESPGLTASLAIAEATARMLGAGPLDQDSDLWKGFDQIAFTRGAA